MKHVIIENSALYVVHNKSWLAQKIAAVLGELSLPEYPQVPTNIPATTPQPGEDHRGAGRDVDVQGGRKCTVREEWKESLIDNKQFDIVLPKSTAGTGAQCFLLGADRHPDLGLSVENLSQSEINLNCAECSTRRSEVGIGRRGRWSSPSPWST